MTEISRLPFSLLGSFGFTSAQNLSQLEEMASSSSSTSKIGVSLEELTCSVCLDLFNGPVTLPCGHSFCCACLENYWKSCDDAPAFVCPNCRAVFPRKPKLIKSVTVANLVDQVKLRNEEAGSAVEGQHDLTGPKDVNSGDYKSRCEVCNGKAAKRCVPCGILCCKRHVQTHKQKGHKVVEPEMNVEELRCTKHGNPIQLFCKDDGSFMCLMCMVGDHQDHKFVPLEIAHTELKEVLAAKYPQVSHSMQDLESELKELQQECLQTQHSDRDTMDRLDGKRRKLYKFVDEAVDLVKSRVNKRQKEKLSMLGKQMEKLTKQIAALQQAKSSLKTALQELADISFLKSYTDLVKRLESLSPFQSEKVPPSTVLEISLEENNLDSFIELNKNILKKIQKCPANELGVVQLDQIIMRSFCK
uniref:E3 ubiquitin/ISG15 ligase TRIM25-like isoform X1 n=2 Tax=Myxine glutinosa TaxID=7769 RepID=UPI00358E6C38